MPFLQVAGIKRGDTAFWETTAQGGVNFCVEEFWPEVLEGTARGVQEPSQLPAFSGVKFGPDGAAPSSVVASAGLSSLASDAAAFSMPADTAVTDAFPPFRRCNRENQFRKKIPNVITEAEEMH